mgnify:CR=1 FL=1
MAGEDGHFLQSKKLGLKTTIGMQMVLVEECVDQIVSYAKLGKELGVDYVQIKQCSEHGTIEHGIVHKNYSDYEKLFINIKFSK